MSLEGQSFYPGETASAEQVAELADEYRRAAEALLPTGRRGAELSRAPYRLMAIHAVELYLNALLRSAGHPPGALRGLQHDLGHRTEMAQAARLGLRSRTVEHLLHLRDTREYLTARYDPVPTRRSELNRLAATLEEVARKVRSRLARPRPRPTLSDRGADGGHGG